MANIIGIVSIHATLAGGDARGRLYGIAALCFYPRHPRGWRQLVERNPNRFRPFLSTPPSRVATLKWSALLFNEGSFYPRHPRGWRHMFFVTTADFFNVSIHATLAGGDQDGLWRHLIGKVFLSTPPSRVATLRPLQSRKGQ